MTPRDHELRQYTPIVTRLVHAFIRTRPIEFDEAFQAGLIGLNTALDRFDHGERRVPFESFASRRIWGAMLDECRAGDHLSRTYRKFASEVRLADVELQHALGRRATEGEIASRLGLQLAEFRDRRRDAADEVRVVSFTALDRADVDWLERHHATAADEDETREAQWNRVVAAFDRLRPRHRVVMHAHFVHGIRFQDIGDAMGLTESRISQMAAEATRHLQYLVRT